jgi:spermidine synthase
MICAAAAAPSPDPMSDAPSPDPHVKPFVFDSRGAKALHFSMGEVQSRMRLDDPDALDLEYTRTMMAVLLFVPEPQRIAMIGLGGGSLAKFCHRHLPAARIQVVEINPHVVALRDEFLVPPDSARFQVALGDGARAVRQWDGEIDVLMIDGFDWEGMPDGLGAQRFYDDCHDALCPGGVMVVNLHLGDARYEVLVDRMRRSFQDAVLTVIDADKSNSIVFAGKGSVLAGYRPGIVRPPPGLDDAAATQLLGAFAQVVAALKATQARSGPPRR